jgi:hypothetical protein
LRSVLFEQTILADRFRKILIGDVVWERRIVTSSNSVSTVQIGGVQAPILMLCSSVVGEDSCSTLITVMLTLIYIGGSSTTPT